jgi:hypothetical protein
MGRKEGVWGRSVGNIDVQKVQQLMNGRHEGYHKSAGGPGKTKSKLALRKSVLLPRPAQKGKPSSPFMLLERSSLFVTSVMIWYACANFLVRIPLNCSRM